MSVPLREPAGVVPAPPGQPVWRLFASSDSVAQGWETIIRLRPNDAVRAYTYLRDHPFQVYPGRCFPLRGKQNRGVWQYEVNGTDRLRYRKASDAADAVVVLYAGDYH